MSLGNTKDQGNKGNNFPYQLRHLQLLSSLLECCEASGTSLAEIIALLTTIEGETANLNIPLSDLNKEATQQLVLTVLGNIKTKTDNLDVLLSTRNAEATQLLIKGLLTPQARTHNIISTSTNGTVPASLRGSVINVGNAAGTWNGISLPAGVAVPWDAIANRDIYAAINYDATGTTFIIEYTT